MTDWSYEAWPPVDPANWGECRHDHPSEHDCHVDLGAGRLKKGRIAVDVRPAPGVNVVMDLSSGEVYAMAPAPGEDAVEPLVPLRGGWQAPQPCAISWGLPFADESIRSVISHHAFEHVGPGFLSLMDDIYRVLIPDGTLRAIVPLFPSRSAVSDPDHCRYFMEDTFDSFCGTPGDTPQNCWLASFSVPYTACRFEIIDKDVTPRCAPEDHWTVNDVRELRVTLRAVK